MNNRTRAFTLIEILVVVGVIALLVAILLPSLSRARRRARTLTCAAHLRTSATGVYYYTQTYRDVYPGGGDWAERSSIYIQRSGTGKQVPAAEASKSGIDRNIACFACPGDPVRHPTGNASQWMGGQLVKPRYRISYGLNAFLANELDDPSAMLDETSSPALSENRRTTSGVANPADIVLLTDAGNDGIHERQEIAWDFDEIADPGVDLAVLEVHHPKGNNFIYADMHVAFGKVLDEKDRQRGVPAFPRHWIPRNGYRGLAGTSP